MYIYIYIYTNSNYNICVYIYIYIYCDRITLICEAAHYCLRKGALGH